MNNAIDVGLLVAAQNNQTLADLEAAYIKIVIKHCNDNKSLAAEKLGIDRRTLYRKLTAFGLMKTKYVETTETSNKATVAWSDGRIETVDLPNI